MKSQNSFILYHDMKSSLDLLEDSELGKVIRAVFEYHATWKEPELDRLCNMAFSTIRATLDRDREKWDIYQEKQSINWKMGWRPKTQVNPNNPSLFLETQVNPSKPKKADSVSVSVSDSVSVSKTFADKSAIQIWFDSFYSLYPKKINRKDAGLKYAVALKKWATIESIEKGLKDAILLWDSEKTDKKYIPAPDVWLNKEKWNDEIKSDIPQNSDTRLIEAKKRLEASLWTPITFN